MDYENLINQPSAELTTMRDAISAKYANLEMADEEDCELLVLDTILFVRQKREERAQLVRELELGERQYHYSLL